MWRNGWLGKKDRSGARSSLFLARWEVTASSEGELVFRLRDRVLTLDALNDLFVRVSQCAARGKTRVEFDFSGVADMESCYSVICAMFIRFVRQVGTRCRVVGLNAKLQEVMAFFLDRVGWVEHVPSRMSGMAA